MRKYMVDAAEHSRHCASHWFRYLRKVITAERVKLTDSDIEWLLGSDRLTAFQKVTLSIAATPGTPMHDYVVSLNQRAKTVNADRLLKEYGIAKK